MSVDWSVVSEVVLSGRQSLDNQLAGCGQLSRQKVVNRSAETDKTSTWTERAVSMSALAERFLTDSLRSSSSLSGRTNGRSRTVSPEEYYRLVKVRI